MKQMQECTITSIHRESPSAFTLDLTSNDGSISCFQPGQFQMVHAFGYGACALSFSGRPLSCFATHTVKEAGSVTNALGRMKVGDRVFVSGPYGKGWPLDKVQGDLVLIAGGVGVAPLRPVIYHIMDHRDRFGSVTLLYGAKDPQDILFKEQWDLFRQKEIDVLISVDRADIDWGGHVGVITSFIDKIPYKICKSTSIFVCGPEVMLRFAIHELRKQQIEESRVFLAFERHMDCGAALCGSCQMGPFLVCRDGPALCLQQIAPYLYIKEL